MFVLDCVGVVCRVGEVICVVCDELVELIVFELGKVIWYAWVEVDYVVV